MDSMDEKVSLRIKVLQKKSSCKKKSSIKFTKGMLVYKFGKVNVKSMVKVKKRVVK